jgi:hypothetical protein
VNASQRPIGCDPNIPGLTQHRGKDNKTRASLSVGIWVEMSAGRPPILPEGFHHPFLSFQVNQAATITLFRIASKLTLTDKLQ